jgi:hypothetical protein
MKNTILSSLIFGIIYSTQALANEKIDLNDSYAASTLQVVSIKNGVGSIQVEVADITSIEVKVAVESTTSYFFFESDISTAKLVATTTNGELTLEVPVQDSEQNWLVRLPKHLALNIDLGVGDANVANISQDLAVNVGVGEFSATVEQTNFKSLTADVGVGGVSLSGFTNSENESHLVGNNAEISGDGQSTLEVDVGVGEINLKNQRK